MKAFHELNEAFPSLLDENGRRKPFERFLNDVRAIDSTYNANYLRAEYNFVAASAEMAARWEGFVEDGDRYNLQYRATKDGRTRPEHAALNGVTLPVSDPMWAEITPPNGWNCRCLLVQVLKSRYPVTDRAEVMRLAEQAFERDTRGMFRFNPGTEGKSVPDYNPYTISRCRGCDIAKGTTRLARFIPENQLCEACVVLRKEALGKNASERIAQYGTDKWDHTYISPDNTGFVITEHTRIAEADVSKNERDKFLKELRMCQVIADNGHEVKYLSEADRPAGKTYDVLIDDVPADLKSLDGASSLVKRVKHALKEQGADAVVLELPSHDQIYYDKITEARRKYNGIIMFYFSDDHVLREIIKK